MVNEDTSRINAISSMTTIHARYKTRLSRDYMINGGSVTRLSIFLSSNGLSLTLGSPWLSMALPKYTRWTNNLLTGSQGLLEVIG